MDERAAGASVEIMNAGLTATFTRRFSEGAVITITNLEAAKSGVTVLFGPSGAGKTTVLRCVAGIEHPDSGAIQFESQIWFDGSKSVFVPARDRNVGFVPQQYGLFPHLSVAGNIKFGIRHLPASTGQSRLAETVKMLRLSGLEGRMPGTLSGGEQQRVALARAIARQPRLLLLDEPLASLDTPLRARLRSELRHLLVELTIPTLLVTHDRNEALALGDRMVVLDRGKIIQSGSIQEVFTRPAQLSVAGILSVETVQPGRIIEKIDGLVTVAVGRATVAALEQPGDESQSAGSDRMKPPELTGQGNFARNAEVHVCIRAEDVVLMKERTGHSSARNCLIGSVRNVISEGATVRIELDCGFPLVALLTKQACAELALKNGDTIFALVKAPHVQLIAKE